MNKDIIIKYLPYQTTQDDLKKIRAEFSNENAVLILIISGQEKLLKNLESLVNID